MWRDELTPEEVAEALGSQVLSPEQVRANVVAAFRERCVQMRDDVVTQMICEALESGAVDCDCPAFAGLLCPDKLGGLCRLFTARVGDVAELS